MLAFLAGVEGDGVDLPKSGIEGQAELEVVDDSEPLPPSADKE